MHYKHLTYGSLFHPSGNSVRATLGMLSLPILLLIPGLLLAAWSAMSALVWLFPLSRWQEMMFERMSSDHVTAIVGTCILAPFLEEMLFRGIILRSFLLQYTRRFSILASAALFGIAHMNLYQFAIGLAIGILAGWIYERARSIWPCILLHGAYNTSLVVIDNSRDKLDTTDVPSISPLLWLAAAVLAFVGTSLLQRILVPRKVAL